MKKIIFLSLVALIMASCSNKADQHADKESVDSVVTVVNEENSGVEVVNPTVLDFSAEWCVWCKRLEPTLKELESKYEGVVDFRMIDTDKTPQLASAYNVKGLPTLVFLNSEGEEISRIEGFTSAENIEKEIAKIK